MAHVLSTGTGTVRVLHSALQGYLAQNKTPTPLGPSQDPRPRHVVGSHGSAFLVQVRYPCNTGLAAIREPPPRLCLGRTKAYAWEHRTTLGVVSVCDFE